MISMMRVQALEGSNASQALVKVHDKFFNNLWDLLRHQPYLVQ